jgi:molybdopterin molybdotransferase
VSDQRPKEQDGRAARSIGRTRLDTACAWIDARVAPLGADSVPLVDAVGSVLAEPVAAAADMPPIDRAVIDGIALRAEDTVGASTYNPLSFHPVPPGETLPPFGTARVGAGEGLPRGADAVVPLDHVSPDAAGAYEIIEPVAAGSEVERAASHAARGALLLPAGRRIRPYDIGLLASAGIAAAPVIRQPEVRVVIGAGDRSERGTASFATGATDTDGVLLRVLIERDGGRVAELRRADHDRRAWRDALAAPGADAVLVAGGGELAVTALLEGGELPIRRIAVYPGESTGIGRTAADVPLFLLPDAPASCLWAYELFAGRAIRRLGGRNPRLPHRRRQMVTTRKIVSSIGVTEICPVRCREKGVEPIASFAEAGVMAAARADGFVIVPEGSEGFAEGAAVTVYLQEECEGLDSEGPTTP